MTGRKKKYLWSWAIAGAAVPLLLMLIGLFLPKPPEQEWDPFHEPKISPTQSRFADVATFLFPNIYVAEFLGLAVTDGGGDSGAVLPATIIFAISILLNAALYLGIGLIVWTAGEGLSRMFRGRSPT
jgi:hypothetical protein